MLDRYSRPEMRAIWNEESKFGAWLKVELLACEAWSQLGEIPAEDVAKLGFCSVPLTLASVCEGTDDPLYGKEPLTSLQAGDKVTLLAFMGDEWAYVQIGLEGRVCRLFIPRSALSQN